MIEIRIDQLLKAHGRTFYWLACRQIRTQVTIDSSVFQFAVEHHIGDLERHVKFQ